MSLYIKIFLGIIFFLCIVSGVLYTQRATENTCNTYISNQSCNKFVTKDNCGSFIDKNNCDPFIDKNNCDKFIIPENCAKHINVNTCDSQINQSNCDKFVTIENCSKYINATTCNSEINKSNCNKFITSENCMIHKSTILGTSTTNEIIGLQTYKVVSLFTDYLNLLIPIFKNQYSTFITQTIYNTAVTEATTENNAYQYKSDYYKALLTLDKLGKKVTPPITDMFPFIIGKLYENILPNNTSMYDSIYNLVPFVNVQQFLESGGYWGRYWIVVAASYISTLSSNPTTFYSEVGKKVPPFNSMRIDIVGRNDAGDVTYQWYIGTKPTGIPFTSPNGKVCTDPSNVGQYKYTALQGANLLCSNIGNQTQKVDDIFKAYQQPSGLHPDVPSTSIYRNNNLSYTFTPNVNVVGFDIQPTSWGIASMNGPQNIDKKLFSERACNLSSNCKGFVTNLGDKNIWAKSALTPTVTSTGLSLYTKPV